MPRVFNTVIFDQWIEGDAVVETPAEFNDLLGRADQVSFQLTVRNSSGTTETITIVLRQCNDNQNFVPHAGVTLWSSFSISGTPKFDQKDTGTAVLGQFLQLAINLGHSDAKAHVQIIACGRTV